MTRTTILAGIAGLALSGFGGAQAAIGTDTAPARLALSGAPAASAGASDAEKGAFDIARRGRGRGGDDRGDDRGRRRGGHGADDTPGTSPSGSGRKRPRIPGGSGCDDPGDILEHPECRV